MKRLQRDRQKTAITSAVGSLCQAMMEDFCPFIVPVMLKMQRIKVDCFRSFLKKIASLHLRGFKDYWEMENFKNTF